MMPTDATTFEWRDANNRYRSMSPLGHNLLVRKCMRNESDFFVGDADKAKQSEVLPCYKDTLNGLLKTMCSRGWMNWCEVLAIGPDCGKPRLLRGHRPSPMDRKKYMIPDDANIELQVGDFVVLPEVSKLGKMWRGITGNDFDVMVDDSEIILRYRELSGGNRDIQPCNDWIILRMQPPIAKMKGVEIGDIAQDRAQYGKVYRCGTGRLSKAGKPIPLHVNHGDMVYVSKFAGIDMMIDGKKYRLIKESDVLAIVEDAA